MNPPNPLAPTADPTLHSATGSSANLSDSPDIAASKSSIEDASQAVTLLAALAQESRLAVFRLLVQAGPAGITATRISELIGAPASSLSFHLKELQRAQLIVARQEGRFINYSANLPVMNGLLGYLTDNCCGGNPCGPTTLSCSTEAAQNSRTGPI